IRLASLAAHIPIMNGRASASRHGSCRLEKNLQPPTWSAPRPPAPVFGTRASVNDAQVAVRHGVTILEVVIVVSVLGVSMAVLIPVGLTAREASRRLGCVNNLKQFGLAMHGFHGAFERLPPSSLTQQIGGRRAETWSWQVLLLPYHDSPTLVDELPI